MPKKTPTIDLLAIVDDVIRSDVKSWPKAMSKGFVDRYSVLSASETTKCIRSLYMEKARPYDHEEPEQGNWGFAERGNSAEAWMVAQLRKFFSPEELLFAGDDQRTFVYGRLSATPDGLLKLEDGDYVYLEIKSIDPRANLRGAPRPAHVAQVKQGMHILANGYDVKPSYGLVIYLNANDYSDMQQFVVKPDPSFVRAQDQKAKRLLDAVAKTDRTNPDSWYTTAALFSPEGLANGSNDCTYCNFVHECGQMQSTKREDDKIAPPQFPTSVVPKATAVRLARFIDLHDQHKELTKAVDEFKAEVKTYMQSANTSAITINDREIVLRNVSGRVTLDRDALSGDGIDLSKYEKVGKPSLQLSVTAKPGS